ncbi:cysteine-rich repeat secretory protein 38 [Gossypium raimondii]|uniref:Gnk2-homologous domain-containing protein n=1 Tax=Gossypium raimondii TaxID=29730 RepID=A0A0D2VJ28_GOSRA|nr:cysteine-rich repeat secretory protein 38 [Gossypium raimondii]KJB70265.1 hypothetical protein B456_011G065600 [Gossypium raimondii]MBA0599234.1 hypothetical protein [Gossypium raimondii]
MSCSRIASFVYLLTLASLLQTAFGLFHNCSDTGSFSAGGPYEANLNQLIEFLSSQTPPSGFGRRAIGQNPNRVFGLALCRGDVSSEDCKTCVVRAGNEIRKQCPYKKGAITWYDDCLVKYSNIGFFGQIDNQNKFNVWNPNKASEAFSRQSEGFLSLLANEASANPTSFYASGEILVHRSMKIYGMTQCTRDLSISDCKKCLDGLIDEFPKCCNQLEGARVFSGSCNFRYENFPFVKA